MTRKVPMIKRQPGRRWGLGGSINSWQLKLQRGGPQGRCWLASVPSMESRLHIQLPPASGLEPLLARPGGGPTGGKKGGPSPGQARRVCLAVPSPLPGKVKAKPEGLWLPRTSILN